MGSKGSKVKDKDQKDGDYETYKDNEGPNDKEKDSKVEKKEEPKVKFGNYYVTSNSPTVSSAEHTLCCAK